VSKIAVSTVQLDKCILLHDYSRAVARLRLPVLRAQTKTLYSLF